MAAQNATELELGQELRGHEKAVRSVCVLKNGTIATGFFFELNRLIATNEFPAHILVVMQCSLNTVQYIQKQYYRRISNTW